jgi:hypothetical protein
MTTLVDRATLGGHTLVYLPRYLAQADSSWERGDDDIADGCFAALCRMIPGLRPADVVARRVSRAREVLAVSTLGYSTDVMPRLQTSHPRVFVCNSAQIAHGTLNVNETVALAERSAPALDGLLARSTREASHV